MLLLFKLVTTLMNRTSETLIGHLITQPPKGQWLCYHARSLRIFDCSGDLLLCFCCDEIVVLLLWYEFKLVLVLCWIHGLVVVKMS